MGDQCCRGDYVLMLDEQGFASAMGVGIVLDVIPAARTRGELYQVRWYTGVVTKSRADLHKRIDLPKL